MIEPTSDQPSKKRKAGDEERYRSLMLQLPRGLGPVVHEIVRKHARAIIDELGIVRAVGPEAAQGLLADPGQDRSRQQTLELLGSLDAEKRGRLDNQNLTGARPAGIASPAVGYKKSAIAEVKGLLAPQATAKPFGYQKGAASTVPGEVQALRPGFKLGAQVLQQLGHLSEVFMREVSDMEYQSMLVNNRLLVAANDPQKIRKLREQKLNVLLDKCVLKSPEAGAADSDKRSYRIGALSQALKTDPVDIGPLTKDQNAGAEMLAELEVGHHVDAGSRPDLSSFLNVLASQSMSSLPMIGPLTPERAGPYIELAPDYSVILVEAPDKAKWHAEQILAMTLIRGGWNGGASVGGTKVPCYVCWLTLNLLPQYGYPLNAVQTPGLYWAGNIGALVEVANALGIATVTDLLTALDRVLDRTDGTFSQFMTDLLGETDHVIDIAGGSKFKKKGLTQDQSRRSFIMSPQESLAGVDDYDNPPDSPPGEYGTDDEAEDA